MAYNWYGSNRLRPLNNNNKWSQRLIRKRFWKIYEDGIVARENFPKGLQNRSGGVFQEKGGGA